MGCAAVYTSVYTSISWVYLFWFAPVLWYIQPNHRRPILEVRVSSGVVNGCYPYFVAKKTSWNWCWCCNFHRTQSKRHFEDMIGQLVVCPNITNMSIGSLQKSLSECSRMCFQTVLCDNTWQNVQVGGKMKVPSTIKGKLWGPGVLSVNLWRFITKYICKYIHIYNYI
jgi:hypothetical protein